MKKMLSLLTVGALLVSSTGMEAAQYMQRARAGAGQAAQRARDFAGAAVGMSKAQYEQGLNFLSKFIDDMSDAIKKSNARERIQSIVSKYKAQARQIFAGAVLVAIGIVLTLAGQAANRWVEGGGVQRVKEGVQQQIGKLTVALSARLTPSEQNAVLRYMRQTRANIYDAVESVTGGAKQVLEVLTDLPGEFRKTGIPRGEEEEAELP